MSESCNMIIGLGKTGLSVARFLQNQKQPFIMMDSRSDPPSQNEFKQLFPDVPLYCGELNPALLSKAKTLIVSPGISLREPAIAQAIKQGISVIGDIELFAQTIKKIKPIIGITGTNGKSTVTTLVGEMIKEAGIKVGVGGNLGTPALDLLSDEQEMYVLELSSFQLETTHSLFLKVGTILNITEDHMDRYLNFDEYVQAKQRIYRHCEFPVINRNDPLSFCHFPTTQSAINFGLDLPQENQFGVIEKNGKVYLVKGEEILIAADEIQIKGKHHIANALAALAIGNAIHLPMNSMLKTLKNFQGLPHRCQWVANVKEVDWYNDSKATNVSSSLAAIEGLGSVISGKLILLMGGLGKQQDFSPLSEPIKKFARGVILFGKDAEQIAKSLEKTVPLYAAKNFEEAIDLAKKNALPKDAVLLSPACASFDMFQNFEHRGQLFMNLVRELEQ